MLNDLGSATSADLHGRAPTVLVPVGSTEQHGPHLPVDTDTRIACAIATATATATARELGLLVAPAIAYGAAGEHQGFPGTVSIGTDALVTVLVEYGRSASDWAPRVVFVNGHGGNLEALRRAITLLRSEGRDAAWCSPSAPGSDAHAGHTETSVLLHVSPELVRIERCRPGNTDPLAALLPRLRAAGVRALSESGVLGDPTTATATHGAALFTEMVEDCAGRVRRWQPGPDGMLT